MKRNQPKGTLEEYPVESEAQLPQHLIKKYKLLKRFRSEFKHRTTKDKTIPNYFL